MCVLCMCVSVRVCMRVREFVLWVGVQVCASVVSVRAIEVRVCAYVYMLP